MASLSCNVTVCALLLTGAASAPSWDLTGYRPQPGLKAVDEGGSLTVRWDGEREEII